MTIIDTHCHLHFDAFDADRDEVIRRAVEAGVGRMVNVGTDAETNEKARALASAHRFMKHSVGLHPHSAHLADAGVLARIETQIEEGRPAAIGEIGLDYFKSEADPETQKNVFRRMLGLAKKNGLPVIVHSRDAFEDTYAILKETGGPSLRGVMHCFSYDEAAMRKLFGLGFLVSFTGNLTFKSASALLETAKRAPLDRFMLETDSPYLAPQARRGKRNEPAFLTELAVFLAEARGEDPERLAETTSRTAGGFFGFS